MTHCESQNFEEAGSGFEPMKTLCQIDQGLASTWSVCSPTISFGTIWTRSVDSFPGSETLAPLPHTLR